ncbi:MAG TPA: hypothetical protein VGJ84_11905, partial [Polyangiaceae bacterium]
AESGPRSGNHGTGVAEWENFGQPAPLGPLTSGPGAAEGGEGREFPAVVGPNGYVWRRDVLDTVMVNSNMSDPRDMGGVLAATCAGTAGIRCCIAGPADFVEPNCADQVTRVQCPAP